MSKLISFIVPTRNLEHLNAQFDKFESTTTDLSAIEFLVKIDSDHQGADAFMQEQIKRRKFTIRYITAPRMAGIFSLWAGVEQLLALVDDTSYFIQILSDEPYYLTQGWDQILRKYIGFFPDHVFRLRLSDVKFNNYATHYECAFRCDSFPIYARRWLELTEGAGDCWGSDAYHQCVAYQLSLGPRGYFNFYRENSLCRDVPAVDLKMGGLDFCVGVSEVMQRERHVRNLREWRRLSGYKMQERFSYLARRMYCYIWAVEHQIPSFKLLTNKKKKNVLVINEAGEIVFSASYRLQASVIFLQNLFRDIYTNYWMRSSYLMQRLSIVARCAQRAKNGFRKAKNTLEKLFLNSGVLPRVYRNSGSSYLEIFLLLILRLVETSWNLLGLIVSLIYSVAMKFLYPVRLLCRMILPVNLRRAGKRMLVICRDVVSSIYEGFKSWCGRKTDIIAKNIEQRYNDHCSGNSHSLAEKLVTDEFLGYKSPGLEVVYSDRCRLPPGIKVLTVDEKSESRKVMQGIMMQRLKFRNKVFTHLRVSGEG